MIFKNYEVENREKAGKAFKIIFNETKEGLWVTDEEKKVKYNIGTFFLRFVKRDENIIENELPEIKYWFDVYYKQKQRYIKSEEKFYYIKGENVINKIKTRLTDKANLNCNKDVLKYLEIYIQNLLNQGIENKSYISIDNEETTAIVKEYIISFMKLIHGKEDIYIENSFEYGENIEYYEQNNICSNKDIFLIEYHTNENYKKIGYVENYMKPDENGNLVPHYYYIHLPELIKLMENEKRFVKKITSQILNVGMRNLGVMALPEGKNISNYKTRNGKFSMNLTKLYVEKLRELAYPLEEIFIKEETKEENDIKEPINGGEEIINIMPIEDEDEDNNSSDNLYFGFGKIVKEDDKYVYIVKLDMDKTVKELMEEFGYIDEYEDIDCIDKEMLPPPIIYIQEARKRKNYKIIKIKRELYYNYD